MRNWLQMIFLRPWKCAIEWKIFWQNYIFKIYFFLFFHKHKISVFCITSLKTLWSHSLNCIITFPSVDKYMCSMYFFFFSREGFEKTFFLDVHRVFLGSPISVPKWKLPRSQSRFSLETGLTETTAVISWMTVFFFCTEIGGFQKIY